MTYSILCLGWPITVEVRLLDDGADIGITGGCRTHVGAVTLAEADGTIKTMLRRDHRDDTVSEAWAAALARQWQMPVCVRCGIHYDGVSLEEIRQIVSATRSLLSQVIREETPRRNGL